MFAESWCLKSNDRIYGPYSSSELRKFAHEGRFAASSLIAPAGSREWREARSEPAFAPFFGYNAARSETANGFGRRDSGADVGRAPRRARPLGQSPRNNPPTEQTTPANFVLIFDVSSAAASRVENALSSLGPAFRLAENVWTVNCSLTAIGVRNAVAPFLKPHEPLFVIDATKGRTSWQNYAPEAHSKITQAYVHARSA
ncbi:MAG TPA: GYF domain-containing protein [Parvularculaceae bacterium]|nr:GYF domain-containing protein [Parvularculaceae bacterium]